MNVASYQARAYPNPPCWALVADVYTSELKQEVEDYKTISGSVRQLASAFRLAVHANPDGFTRVGIPVDYAVVLMGRVPALGVHHCGIFYKGKVLHATPEGTLYQDLASLQDAYRVMEFWVKCRNLGAARSADAERLPGNACASATA